MEKIKKIIKENISFFVVFVCLLFLTVTLFITKNYAVPSGDMNLELDIYGKIIIPNIIIVGTLYFFLLNIAKKKDIKIENVFLLIAIPIGIAYMVAFPIGTTPDDQAHYLRSWEVSLGRPVSEQNEKGDGGGILPANLTKVLFNVGTHHYKEYFETAPNETVSDQVYFQWCSTASLYSFVCYLPQALGIAFARIFTDNLMIMAYSARIFNFAAFVTLVYFAIKVIPFKKAMAMVIALMPIVFQEAVSISPDALTIASSMMLISYIFYLKYSVKSITKKNIVILIALSILLALCKIVYIPICFIIYTIPFDKFKSKKHKYIITTSIIVIAFAINLLWIGFASRYLVEYNAGVNSVEQVKFVLTNPIDYITIIMRTLDARIDAYIHNILGDLSIYNISLSPIFKRILFTVLILCICINEEKKCEVKKMSKAIIAFSLVLVIVLVFTSIYVQWTAVGNPFVEGVQGRYFIPILILLPYLFNNLYFVSDKKISFRYLLMFMVFLNLHAISYILMTYK